MIAEYKVEIAKPYIAVICFEGVGCTSSTIFYLLDFEA